MRTTHKHGVEPTLTKEERKEVRKRFADAGVEIWGCGSTCEFHSPVEAEVKKQIETCKRFVELAADIGGKGVKVRPNGLPRGVAVEKTLEQIGKALIPCGKAAADAGVEIWVEVHGKGTQDPPNMKTIMEVHATTTRRSYAVTWNSNPTDIKNGSVAEYFKLLSPWIRSCHINDLYKDAAGTYPYRELFGLMRGIGYDRVTMIEIGRSWPDSDAATEMLKYYKAACGPELCRELKPVAATHLPRVTRSAPNPKRKGTCAISCQPSSPAISLRASAAVTSLVWQPHQPCWRPARAAVLQRIHPRPRTSKPSPASRLTPSNSTPTKARSAPAPRPSRPRPCV